MSKNRPPLTPSSIYRSHLVRMSESTMRMGRYSPTLVEIKGKNWVSSMDTGTNSTAASSAETMVRYTSSSFLHSQLTSSTVGSTMRKKPTDKIQAALSDWVATMAGAMASPCMSTGCLEKRPEKRSSLSCRAPIYWRTRSFLARILRSNFFMGPPPLAAIPWSGSSGPGPASPCGR